jgi:hypothetical protein
MRYVMDFNAAYLLLNLLPELVGSISLLIH